MKPKPDLPYHIIKKSRNYYYNTLSGQYIRAEHLSQYLSDKQSKPVRREADYWWTNI